ncbi:MAG: cell division protein FtsZ [Acidobacteria bacterium]|nr:cell division protein FtsZ [Acidobacteriota bacterium]
MDTDDLRFVFEEETRQGARIKVIGVGGGGCNAVNRMIHEHVEGVEFAVVNTDVQALRESNAHLKVQIGAKLTKGLGSGSDPEIGRRAALEDTDKLIEILEGADIVFITSGLGGGTGGGAAPIVASLANELDALTVAVVTKPFAFEGRRRMKQAERGLAELAETVDTVIIIPNERLLHCVPHGTSFFESFRIADDILRQAVQGISDIITIPGIINRDFADVKAIMQGMGYAMMGTATASGENRAVEAARQAISSPLLEDATIDGARGILLNVTGSSSLGLHEVHEASSIIQQAAHEDANIIFGAVQSETMGDMVKITVIATGFKGENIGIHRAAGAGVVAAVRPYKTVSVPREEEPAPAPEPVPEPLAELTPEMAEDVDVPAYIRRPRSSGQ